MGGDAHREGAYQCNACREQFTVTVGTVMEDSHLPLSKWALAFHFMASSKKGIRALQLMRNLGLGSYRTAWFLAHRIREAMKGPELPESPLKGIVEVDEAYIGGKPRHGDGKVHKRGMGTSKTPVVSLVERDGRKRTVVMPKVTANNIREVVNAHVAPNAEIHTDDSRVYILKTRRHSRVNHSKKQYAFNRVDGVTVTTNTVESSFALLKRGVYGTFHHVSKKHLHRYCNEFDFRWNGRGLKDTERRDEAVKGSEGKRLTYKAPIARPKK